MMPAHHSEFHSVLFLPFWPSLGLINNLRVFFLAFFLVKEKKRVFYLIKFIEIRIYNVFTYHFLF